MDRWSEGPQPVQDGVLAPPAGLEGSVFRLGGREFARLRWSAGAPVLPPALSPAEAEVVQLALAGRSNADIAALRGTSARTVANQLAGAFQKLGVQSRHELHALVLRRRGLV